MDYREKIKQLAAILDQMIRALEVANDTRYLRTFKCFRGDCEYVENEQGAKDLARNIKSIYIGGMGSFNDFVLHTNGKYIKEPSMQFDRLQTDLFDACVDIITKPRESN
jgi:hypothetical protein